jgi:hypothetical protein
LSLDCKKKKNTCYILSVGNKSEVIELHFKH